MNDRLSRLAISQSSLFKDWPEEAIARLLESSDVLVVEPRSVVHRAGDDAKYLLIVVSGSLVLSQDMSSGRSFSAAVHLPGDFHGLAPILSQEPYIHTVVCKERTVLVRIAGEALREMIAANGRLSFALFGALERRYLQVLNLHASAAVNSIQARIAALLKSIAARSVKGHSSSEIHLSQDEIAAMLGTRRQVINRALREMTAEGVIQVQYGRIAIVDAEKLDSMAPDAL